MSNILQFKSPRSKPLKDTTPHYVSVNKKFKAKIFEIIKNSKGVSQLDLRDESQDESENLGKVLLNLRENGLIHRYKDKDKIGNISWHYCVKNRTVEIPIEEEEDIEEEEKVEEEDVEEYENVEEEEEVKEEKEVEYSKKDILEILNIIREGVDKYVGSKHILESTYISPRIVQKILRDLTADNRIISRMTEKDMFYKIKYFEGLFNKSHKCFQAEFKNHLMSIFLSYLLDLYEQFSKKNTLMKDDSFYRSGEKIMKDLNINGSKLSRLKGKLKKLGFLDYKNKKINGKPYLTYWYLNHDRIWKCKNEK